jgi:Nucleotidyl transferase AbiEii toxin, Type IV TA system
MIQLHYKTITQEMHDVLKKLMQIPELNHFRLVGGTALSLQLGHRESIDLDLFTDINTDFALISSIILNNFKNVSLRSSSANGRTFSIDGVKVDIYDWHVRFIHEPLIIDEIRMSSITEIGTYKFDALTNRRSEKDFIDIAEILKHTSFKDLLTAFKQRYPYIQTGAFLPYLLSPHLFERDDTIIWHSIETFESAAERISKSLKTFEEEGVNAALKIQEERNARLEEILKRKKKE